jgi:threonine/homoserine/homoserine lactone efflux protein
MISTELLLAFLAASVLITLAPGPDNAMVLSLGISRGREAGVGFGIGCALGCFIHTLWATLGIGAVVQGSDATFTTLKMAGATYLVYLSLMAWKHAGKGGLIDLDKGNEPITVHIRRGFIANAVNPKVALFFIAYLPQFVDPAHGPVWSQMLLLGVIFAIQTTLIFGGLGWFSGSIGARLQRQPALGLWLDRGTAVLFLGIALRLAFAER